MSRLLQDRRGIVGAVTVLAALAVGLSPWPKAEGLIMVDIDWEVGSLPTDSGYPANAPTVDTTAGTWTNTSGYHGFDGLVDQLTPGAMYVHGFADIRHNSFSTNVFDQTVVRFSRKPAGDPDFHFDVNFLENAMVIRHGIGAGSGYGNISNTSIPVSNSDGQIHRYGWELDRTGADPVIRLFFDDLTTPVGDPAGYNVAFGTADGNEHYWGDGTGGQAHEDVWFRYVIQEGRIPEPASLALLGLTGLCLLGRGRRA